MKPTILYIEDDGADRLLVERALLHAGYNVVVAERGLEGLDLARRIEPDLILTDLVLPDLSGREMATILRCDERFHYTPIVALTGYGSEYRDTAFAAGVTGYLTKPLDIEALPYQIRFYLSGGQDEVEIDRLADAQLEYTREVVKRLENRVRDLEAANESIFYLDQLKDTFIQLSAHELRTPLTLVYGYSRLLTDHPPLQQMMQQDENMQGLLRGLGHAIERMQNIIEELLTMSRIMTNQINMTTAPTHLGQLVQKVLISAEPVLRERNLNVYFDESQWPSSVLADGELLKLAMSNLLSNAIKYTPDGGRISLTAKSNGQYVRFSVRDTGIGIDKADQQRIFERFHTVRDVSTHTTSKTAFGGGGLGLGLPICKGIIEAHGGRIWVESTGHDPHRMPGSEFFVQLPLVTNGKTRPPSSVIKKLQQ